MITVFHSSTVNGLLHCCLIGITLIRSTDQFCTLLLQQELNPDIETLAKYWCATPACSAQMADFIDNSAPPL